MGKKFIIIFSTVLALIAVSAGAAYFWVQQQLQPASTDATVQRFVVNKGQALAVTAQKLAEQGLIRHPQVFRYYSQFNSLDRKMQAGSYELSPNMSTAEIAEALTQGTEDIWITIPEGWRREEIAAYLGSQAELTQFDEEEFMTLTDDLEGTLFPDTYLIAKDSTTEFIVSLLTNTFETKVTEGLADQFENSTLTPEEVIVLASIVEREGKGYENMRHVAGVLMNRLDIDMALQADATLQYIRGIDPDGKWWTPPTIDLKNSTSPFNTYATTGLPPEPIANPGLDAIKAVLDPLDTNDLYYIHAPSGESYFAETLDEHNANVNKYLR